MDSRDGNAAVKYIISGTNRPGSRTLQIAKVIQGLYQELGEEIEMIDLTHVGLEQVGGAAAYGDAVPADMRAAIEKVNHADGLVVVCPEYNGSMPGALKYFIDHWKYPDSYEFRPVAFVGLGGRFGALRSVEHLQGVFGYRNAFIYPERVFISDVANVLKDGQLVEPRLLTQLRSQARGFQAFTAALVKAGLDANSRTASRASSPS